MSLNVVVTIFVAVAPTVHGGSERREVNESAVLKSNPPPIPRISQKGACSMKIKYPTLAVLSVFVLLAGLMLTQPALAQAQEGQTFEGELTKVDSTAKTLSVKSSKGQEMEFRYNDQTQISGAEGGVEGLATKSGTPVKVHYDATSKTATKIEIKQHQK